MTPKEHLIESLKRLCDREGGHEKVAAKAGVSSDALWQVLKGIRLPSGQPRGIGPGTAKKLEDAFPGWAGLLPDVKNSHSSDQSMSLDVYTVPLEVDWGELMLKRDAEIPELFTVSMPDDALLPRIERGTQLVFSKSDEPTPGKGVLVRDGSGELHIRKYKQGLAGGFVAQALNEEYATLERGRDGLEIVAVLRGVLSGRL